MNKNIRLTIILSSLFLGMSLLFNHSIAEEVEKAQQSPIKKVALSEKPSPDIASLKEMVSKYIETWHNKDFESMYSFENWEGGEELDDVNYFQKFKKDFNIHTWKITQATLEKGKTDEYKVLILITHNLPEHIATLVSKNKVKTVRSTLTQWWKKQGDKFVHLFHIERQRLMKLFPAPPPSESLPNHN
ncbi:hypothetical protein [Candidatus Parabeggiatoa sp. HSG14]|uniref:hypothetical protein n=1 Tax=Candidatus Parabeggiatoa sp. HSG14 TaxID=3055593 RepID=UPI0025A90080|nr:hypothetical protein [Thiotrichales bacterium HSG14]